MENKKKDCKALFFIHQSVDCNNFENITSARTTKKAQEILEKCYQGAKKIKKMRLKTLRRQFEPL